MNPGSTYTGNEGYTGTEPISDEGRGLGNQAREKVSEFANRAAERLDAGREKTAGVLDKAGNSLQSGVSKVTSAAHSAADRLQDAARYVREKNVRDMGDDLGQVVRRNPGPSLLIALATGFLLGQLFTRNNDNRWS